MFVLLGEGDAIQSIGEAKSRAALMPHSHFEVVSGGHEPWFDDLEGCTGLVSAFQSS